MKERLKLPVIIRYDGVDDYGEYGAALCPHCGAKGRYIYRFTTEDGGKGGAMAGCIKLFPQSSLARTHKAILDKEKTGGKLNSWDTKMLAAVDAAASGEMSREAAELVVRTEQQKRASWMRKKFGR